MNLEASNGNSYNNADSFAMAFDAAWKDCDLEKNNDIKHIRMKSIICTRILSINAALPMTGF